MLLSNYGYCVNMKVQWWQYVENWKIWTVHQVECDGGRYISDVSLGGTIWKCMELFLISYVYNTL